VKAAKVIIHSPNKDENIEKISKLGVSLISAIEKEI
jgi:hypothetical protein